MTAHISLANGQDFFSVATSHRPSKFWHIFFKRIFSIMGYLVSSQQDWVISVPAVSSIVNMVRASGSRGSVGIASSRSSIIIGFLILVVLCSSSLSCQSWHSVYWQPQVRVSKVNIFNWDDQVSGSSRGDSDKCGESDKNLHVKTVCPHPC